MEASVYRFFSDFDSGNLCKAEGVSVGENENYEAEFQIWTKPDCYGTEFQVSRTCTWFYFGMSGGSPGAKIKFNIMNIGRQTSLFKQGMRPVCRVSSESDQWRRISEDPTVIPHEDGCILSFMFNNPENTEEETFLALTYPYQYEHLQHSLQQIEQAFCNFSSDFIDYGQKDKHEIYVARETVVKSLDGLSLDLLTITDLNGIQDKLEEALPDLFPDLTNTRAHTFADKEIVFVSSRVHPGETCASYVTAGFVDFLLLKENEQAVRLREKYVFKILPMLNPDGVARGHYRHDTRGVNLNRVYENPSMEHSPTIFAAKQLIDYYGGKSNIFLYVDIHGHTNERGIFALGNHSDDTEFKTQTYLFPKLLAINSPQFSYKSCKTTSLTLSDLVAGTNLDGCGSTYTHHVTGLAQAYTLECSFSGGDTELGGKEEYTPETYQHFGKSMAESILDLTDSNPQSKIRDTAMKNLQGVKSWVAKRIKAAEIGEAARKSTLANMLNDLATKVAMKASEGTNADMEKLSGSLAENSRKKA